MKNIITVLLIIMVFGAVSLHADMLGNPGSQVGEKNLFVGIEYSNISHTTDIAIEKDTAKSAAKKGLKVTLISTFSFNCLINIKATIAITNPLSV